MFSRREFLKFAGVTAGAVSFSGSAFSMGMGGKKVSSKPNIVFILADDMGYGDLACQNSESKIPTPCLDKLATEGMRFTDAHSPSAVCSPTRYGILTGRYCWRTELKSSVLWPWDRSLIEKDRLTAPMMLKDAGYSTACVGKWHLGWEWATKDNSRINDQLKIGRHNNKLRTEFGKKIDFTQPIKGGPLGSGFDYYFGDDVPNFPPYCFVENDRVVEMPSTTKPGTMFGSPGPMQPGWKLEDVMPAITDKAVEYVEGRAAKKDEPFFLFFTLTAPHTPIAPAAEFKGKSEAGAYGDYVYQVDHSVGQVLDALKRNGFADDTLVIFTSDNGSPGRDGSNMNGGVSTVRKYGHNPSRPWRGVKSDAWDGGHRVPFIARWPKNIPAGAVNDELICHVDFMSTAAAIIGKELPANAAEDSYNILSALKGKELDKPIREAVVHHSGGGMFCVRQGKWKLIFGLGAAGFSGPKLKPKPGEPD
ncbi:MAG: sulfatase-like hydrolase/transferase, partial [Anaerohalosphaera sp.]|nr:sulfatase-like hydrolase/transferase [Anaerohalosphaera sp.]